MVVPKNIILLSGKRKSGKDYLAELLNKRLGACSEIIRISMPIKSEYAKKNNLDLDELLSDGTYKEMYRRKMIEWSDSVRLKDYSFFCRAAMGEASKEIVIVSDIRRKSDIKYFTERFGDKIYKVRITCPNEIRIQRGWVFQSGVDDSQSECDLDDYNQWDLVVQNDGILDASRLTEVICEKFHL